MDDDGRKGDNKSVVTFYEMSKVGGYLNFSYHILLLEIFLAPTRHLNVIEDARSQTTKLLFSMRAIHSVAASP